MQIEEKDFFSAVKAASVLISLAFLPSVLHFIFCFYCYFEQNKL